MLSAKLIFLGGGGFAVLTVGTAVITLQADSLTLVERYGLLGLHAAVVLGLGGFIIRIGWQIERTAKRQAIAMEKLADRLREAKDEHEEILREVRELQRTPRK